MHLGKQYIVVLLLYLWPVISPRNLEVTDFLHSKPLSAQCE